MKFNIQHYAFIGASLLVSCTDLEPKLYSELTPTTVYTTDDVALGALLQNYRSLGQYGSEVNWPLQELSSETSVAAAKFGPWDDGGVWARLHRHEWQSSWGQINAAWSMGFSGIAGCNRTIDELTARGGAEAAIIELRALRALYYWIMIDFFGDVPLETSFVNGQANPSRKPRGEVYQFVVDELNASLESGLLSETNGGSFYGRMNRWSTLALLTKLYLNAEVYAKKVEWANAAETAKIIIDEGPFIIESNYASNFTIQNRGSKENILVIPYSKSDAGGFNFNMHMRTLHPLNRQTYNFNEGPWNGFTALEEFYKSYDPADLRKQTFIVGQQYTASGDPINDPNGAIEIDSEGNHDPDGPPLIFTPEINELTPKAFSQSGARIGKFEFESGIGTNADNDFPIFRYADILLMRAEALWRLNNGSAEAVDLVRQVRERAGLAKIEPLTKDALYHEILRELAYECHSRPTMIRFGTFTAPRWEKPLSADTRTIYPVPDAQRNGNPNLGQNPGY